MVDRETVERVARALEEVVAFEGFEQDLDDGAALLRALLDERDAARAERDTARAAVVQLKAELDGYERWARDVNEALNTGDGSYRP